MALGIALIIIGIIGLVFGMKKHNKAMTISSILLLIFVAVIYAIYAYLYSLTPY